MPEAKVFCEEVDNDNLKAQAYSLVVKILMSHDTVTRQDPTLRLLASVSL